MQDIKWPLPYMLRKELLVINLKKINKLIFGALLIISFLLISFSLSRPSDPARQDFSEYSRKPYNDHSIYATYQFGADGYIAQSDIVARGMVVDVAKPKTYAYPGMNNSKKPVYVFSFSFVSSDVLYISSRCTDYRVGEVLNWIVLSEGFDEKAVPEYEVKIGEEYLVFFRKALLGSEREMVTLRGPRGRLSSLTQSLDSHEIFGNLGMNDIVSTVKGIAANIEITKDQPTAVELDIQIDPQDTILSRYVLKEEYIKRNFNALGEDADAIVIFNRGKTGDIRQTQMLEIGDQIYLDFDYLGDMPTKPIAFKYNLTTTFKKVNILVSRRY